MILATISQTVIQAQAEYEAKYARRKPVEEAAPAATAEPALVAPSESPAAPAVTAAPQV